METITEYRNKITAIREEINLSDFDYRYFMNYLDRAEENIYARDGILREVRQFIERETK